MTDKHQSLVDDLHATDYHADVVEKSYAPTTPVEPKTFKRGDAVKGIGTKHSWLRGIIIGINYENNSYAVRTKEGAITALYNYQIDKE